MQVRRDCATFRAMNEPEMQGALKQVHATGPIIGVVVHGRGAVITRRIEIDGPLPTESFDLSIGEITPLADPGVCESCSRTTVDNS